MGTLLRDTVTTTTARIARAASRMQARWASNVMVMHRPPISKRGARTPRRWTLPITL